MIRSFRHRGLKLLYQKSDGSKLRPDFEAKIERALARLDQASDARDTNLLSRNAMSMKHPPHPGLSVRHDCIEAVGLSVTDAARRLGVSRRQLSDIVNGHAGISPEMAIRLDKAFGGGAETWLRLQLAYDLAQAMERAHEIHVERIIPAT